MRTSILILSIMLVAVLPGCGLFDVGQNAAENEGEAAPLLVGTTQDRPASATQAENDGKAVSPSAETSQGRTAATREESAGEVRPLSAITASVSYRGPTSLEERIFASQVITRVRLDSATSTRRLRATVSHGEWRSLIASVPWDVGDGEFMDRPQFQPGDPVWICNSHMAVA